jgi:hypothetical protein
MCRLFLFLSGKRSIVWIPDSVVTSATTAATPTLQALQPHELERFLLALLDSMSDDVGSIGLLRQLGQLRGSIDVF